MNRENNEFIKKKRESLEKLYQLNVEEEEMNQEDNEVKEYLISIIKHLQCNNQLLLKSIEQSKQSVWKLFWIGFHSCWIGVVLARLLCKYLFNLN